MPCERIPRTVTGWSTTWTTWIGRSRFKLIAGATGSAGRLRHRWTFRRRRRRDPSSPPCRTTLFALHLYMVLAPSTGCRAITGGRVAACTSPAWNRRPRHSLLRGGLVSDPRRPRRPEERTPPPQDQARVFPGAVRRPPVNRPPHSGFIADYRAGASTSSHRRESWRCPLPGARAGLGVPPRSSTCRSIRYGAWGLRPGSRALCTTARPAVNSDG